MRRIILAIGVATAVAGCAKSPDSIAPAYVSEVPYDQWSWKQLTDEELRLNQALAKASAQQQNARTMMLKVCGSSDFSCHHYQG
jgi:Prokaryotic membrane lipoprotein lipid attachment site